MMWCPLVIGPDYTREIPEEKRFFRKPVDHLSKAGTKIRA